MRKRERWETSEQLHSTPLNHSHQSLQAIVEKITFGGFSNWMEETEKEKRGLLKNQFTKLEFWGSVLQTDHAPSELSGQISRRWRLFIECCSICKAVNDEACSKLGVGSAHQTDGHGHADVGCQDFGRFNVFRGKKKSIQLRQDQSWGGSTMTSPWWWPSRCDVRLIARYFKTLESGQRLLRNGKVRAIYPRGHGFEILYLLSFFF